MTEICFRCKSKSTDEFRTITVELKTGEAWCDCDSFTIICSHIDATLVAGERHMVPPEDRQIADQAMAATSGKIQIPSDWKGSWRKRSVWRGLAAPRPSRDVNALTKEFGTDYYARPKVCFTGTGPISRKDLLQVAREAGWQAVDEYQVGLKVLVAEDPTRNTNKLKQARKHAVPILSYEEWANLNSQGEMSS